MAQFERFGFKGCGDNSCLFETPKGVGTNASCRCPQWKFVRAVQMQERENKMYHAILDDLLASGCLGREEEKAALKMLTEKEYSDELRIAREL